MQNMQQGGRGSGYVGLGVCVHAWCPPDHLENMYMIRCIHDTCVLTSHKHNNKHCELGFVACG